MLQEAQYLKKLIGDLRHNTSASTYISLKPIETT